MKSTKVIIVLILSSMVIFHSSTCVEAQENELFSFSIIGSDYSYVDLTASPGEHFSFSIRLYNSGTITKTNTLFISDGYTAKNGGTKIILPEEATLVKTGGWMELTETKITLKPGEDKIVDIHGVVPEDAGPGTYIAVLYLRSEEVQGHTGEATVKGARFQVNEVYSLSCAVVIRLEGEVYHIIKADDDVDKRWVKGKDLVLTCEIENAGNIYDFPEITLQILDEEKKEVYQIVKTLDIVYPENRCQVDFYIPPDRYMAKRYTGELTILYGTQKAQKVSQKFDLDLSPKEISKAQQARKQSEELQKTYLISDQTVFFFFIACFTIILSIYLLFFTKQNKNK